MEGLEELAKRLRERILSQCLQRAIQARALELWYNPHEKNSEQEEVLTLLEKPGERYEVRLVDATRTTCEGRKQFYYEVVLQPYNRGRRGYFVAYLVRGTPKDYDFGVERPLLIVYGDADQVIYIYPHQEVPTRWDASRQYLSYREVQRLKEKMPDIDFRAVPLKNALKGIPIIRLKIMITIQMFLAKLVEVELVRRR